MNSVFTYTDYRLFLRDRFNALRRKDRQFTYTVFAKKAGFKSPGFITQVLQNKSRLTPDMAQRFAKALELGKLESEYFSALVKTNQAHTHSDRSDSTQKLLAVKNIRVKTVAKDQFEYYNKWYYSAIRSMLDYYQFDGDYEKLGTALSPSILPSQAKKAVKLLLKLGLLEIQPNGVYKLKDNLITTGEEHQSVAVVNYQLETMDLAKWALENIPRNNRTSATLTLGLSAESHTMAMEKIATLRKELMALAAADEAIDRVIQVNLHAFPLTHLAGGKE